MEKRQCGNWIDSIWPEIDFEFQLSKESEVEIDEEVEAKVEVEKGKIETKKIEAAIRIRQMEQLGESL